MHEDIPIELARSTDASARADISTTPNLSPLAGAPLRPGRQLVGRGLFRPSGRFSPHQVNEWLESSVGGGYMQDFSLASG